MVEVSRDEQLQGSLIAQSFNFLFPMEITCLNKNSLIIYL
jgi:hypothetical protein